MKITELNCQIQELRNATENKDSTTQVIGFSIPEEEDTLYE